MPAEYEVETVPKANVSNRKVHKAGKAAIIPILVSISKSTRALTGLKLAEIGFHNGQDELLFALNEETPSSVSEIAEEITVRPSTVSKMLDRLAKGGLVERVSDRRDGRVTMVKITDEGMKARDELFDTRNALEEELRSMHPDNDLLIDVLQIVSTTLKNRLSRLR